LRASASFGRRRFMKLYSRITTSVLELRRRRRGQPMQPGSEILLASLIMPALVITALLVATLLT
jgi:hypothetical protein